VTITGPTDPGEIDEYFREPGKMPEGRQCGCFKSMAIQPNGDCVMCADYIMGNIADNSLTDIWNGPKALKWRNYLREHGNPGVLAKCSRLYPNIRGGQDTEAKQAVAVSPPADGLEIDEYSTSRIEARSVAPLSS
jgi:MoaA/NifB/PqqE/SkfB family radical SAM enzyme